MLRVALPDRPGSLGAVASAMGTVAADIHAVEIVEKSDGYAIDDFMLSLPPTTPPDSVVTACKAIDDVDVLWISHTPENWGLLSDIEMLDKMLADPKASAQALVQGAPAVFHVQWAILVDLSHRSLADRTELAPDSESGDVIAALGPLHEPRVGSLPKAWLPAWSETEIAVAPCRGARAVVIGRTGGPEFLRSELGRLRHLAAFIQ